MVDLEQIVLILVRVGYGDDIAEEICLLIDETLLELPDCFWFE